jgi:hypothetical protein
VGVQRAAPFRTVTAFEHHDGERTHRFPTDPLPDGPLRVHARTAPDALPGPYNLVTGAPDELFVLFGVYAEIDGCDGARIARLDADTLELVWCVRLQELAQTGRWNYMGVLGVMPDGDLVAIAGCEAYRVDRRDGAIVARVDLPAAGPARDAAFNGYAPLSDGRLVTKSVHRSGTDVDGFAAFMAGQPFAAPCSTVAVIDPDTWTVMDAVEAPEHVGGRITTTTLDGVDVVYLVGFDQLYRWRWDGSSLRPDPTWRPVTVRRDSQTPAPANAVCGDFTVLQTNAVPSPQPMSIHCIDQRDPERRDEVQPFADCAEPVSFLPAMLSVDPEHHRVYSHDAAAGKLAAFDLDPSTGALTRAWRVDQRSLSFTTLVGPVERRVIVGTDIVGLDSFTGLLSAPAEQVVLRDAATGAELARSADLPRMSHGVLVTPGFEGRLYELGLRGTITELTIESAPSHAGGA